MPGAVNACRPYLEAEVERRLTRCSPSCVRHSPEGVVLVFGGKAHAVPDALGHLGGAALGHDGLLAHAGGAVGVDRGRLRGGNRGEHRRHAAARLETTVARLIPVSQATIPQTD